MRTFIIWFHNIPFHFIISLNHMIHETYILTQKTLIPLCLGFLEQHPKFVITVSTEVGVV